VGLARILRGKKIPRARTWGLGKTDARAAEKMESEGCQTVTKPTKEEGTGAISTYQYGHNIHLKSANKGGKRTGAGVWLGGVLASVEIIW